MTEEQGVRIIELLESLAHESGEVAKYSMHLLAAINNVEDVLKKQNEMMEVLVAAEYANAQATENLMKSFEGSSGNRAFDASLKQMRRMGGLENT
jgi:hypothetical protein